jgi:hypothetical protein
MPWRAPRNSLTPTDVYFTDIRRLWPQPPKYLILWRSLRESNSCFNLERAGCSPLDSPNRHWCWYEERIAQKTLNFISALVGRRDSAPGHQPSLASQATARQAGTAAYHGEVSEGCHAEARRGEGGLCPRASSFAPDAAEIQLLGRSRLIDSDLQYPTLDDGGDVWFREQNGASAFDPKADIDGNKI